MKNANIPRWKQTILNNIVLETDCDKSYSITYYINKALKFIDEAFFIKGNKIWVRPSVQMYCNDNTITISLFKYYPNLEIRLTHFSNEMLEIWKDYRADNYCSNDPLEWLSLYYINKYDYIFNKNKYKELLILEESTGITLDIIKQYPYECFKVYKKLYNKADKEVLIKTGFNINCKGYNFKNYYKLSKNLIIHDWYVSNKIYKYFEKNFKLCKRVLTDYVHYTDNIDLTKFINKPNFFVEDFSKVNTDLSIYKVRGYLSYHIPDNLEVTLISKEDYNIWTNTPPDWRNWLKTIWINDNEYPVDFSTTTTHFYKKPLDFLISDKVEKLMTLWETATDYQKTNIVWYYNHITLKYLSFKLKYTSNYLKYLDLL